jgi:formylglycine-generating enzyme required for sulfatase activity
MPLIEKRKTHTAQFFTQQLGPTSLDMVRIPAGSFQMGSPKDELERRDNEGPQHRVTVPEFCLGKYPITQAQWRFVASLPQVEQALKEAEPSSFKGDDRPVENVSWDDAVEFCARLSGFADRQYRLPSEAEWEYACRAGTITPFHVGETITTDLANYRGTDDEGYKWSGSYGRGPKGIYRKETTPIGTFPPNAFGLYDMHGNVWEWCADHWHSNYESAPTDGSAWLSDEKDANRLLRGGSWDFDPRSCRSAVRVNGPRVHRDDGIGFRVSCSAARILP